MKKNEIENHKVERQHWPNPEEFITYTIKKWKHLLSFSIYQLKQVSDFPFPPDLEPP